MEDKEEIKKTTQEYLIHEQPNYIPKLTINNDTEIALDGYKLNSVLNYTINKNLDKNVPYATLEVTLLVRDLDIF